jgi:LPXTG-motif cell wall-anchored protein
MIGLIVFLLILWVVLSIVGFTIKGLFWLAIIGIVLFLATAVFGWFRRKSPGA